jgi:hypothetical protein
LKLPTRSNAGDPSFTSPETGLTNSIRVRICVSTLDFAPLKDMP